MNSISVLHKYFEKNPGNFDHVSIRIYTGDSKVVMRDAHGLEHEFKSLEEFDRYVSNNFRRIGDLVLDEGKLQVYTSKKEGEWVVRYLHKTKIKKIGRIKINSSGAFVAQLHRDWHAACSDKTLAAAARRCMTMHKYRNT